MAVQPLLSLDLVDTSWQSSSHEGDDSLHALRASNNSLYPNDADRWSNVRPLYPDADALLHAISDTVCPTLLLVLLRFLYLQCEYGVKNSPITICRVKCLRCSVNAQCIYAFINVFMRLYSCIHVYMYLTTYLSQASRSQSRVSSYILSWAVQAKSHPD